MVPVHIHIAWYCIFIEAKSTNCLHFLILKDKTLCITVLKMTRKCAVFC